MCGVRWCRYYWPGVILRDYANFESMCVKWRWRKNLINVNLLTLNGICWCMFHPVNLPRRMILVLAVPICNLYSTLYFKCRLVKAPESPVTKVHSIARPVKSKTDKLCIVFIGSTCRVFHWHWTTFDFSAVCLHWMSYTWIFSKIKRRYESHWQSIY